MRPAIGRIAWAALLTAATGSAQLSDASLRGKYHFVQLMATGSSVLSQEVRNTWGAITFDGAGAYTWTGKSAAGTAAPAAASGSGVYSVSPAGVVSLAGFSVQAGFSSDGKLLVGATTDANDNTQSLWIGLRAVAGAPPLAGTYTGVALASLAGPSPADITASVTWTADGQGTFTNVAVTGHSSARYENNVRQEAGGAIYRVDEGGTGLAWLGVSTPLLTGDHDIFLSENGEYVLGCSIVAGLRDLVLVTKKPATGQTLDGSYWVADLSFENDAVGSGWGKLATMGGRALLSQRVRLGVRSIDYSGVNYYSVGADNSGSFASLPGSTVANMTLGAGGDFAAVARIDSIDTISSQHGVAFLVRAPQPQDIMNPVAGLVSAAAFPPYPSPISPGQIQSLFGVGLSSQTQSAAALPLPTNMAGVQVFVNGVAAPLYLVSPGQINFQTPFGVTGNSATIRVVNNQSSSQATAPLAPTNPGLFTWAVPGESPVRGIVLHANMNLVTPSNPAAPGETVVLYLTGLGELDPSVVAGAANPSSPLAWMREPRLSVLFGGEAATRIWYAGGAPTFAGLNQINVDIPYSAPESDFTPVSLATPNAFSDVAEIAIRRRR